jgi:hypothetical protein
MQRAATVRKIIDYGCSHCVDILSTPGYANLRIGRAGDIEARHGRSGKMPASGMFWGVALP